MGFGEPFCERQGSRALSGHGGLHVRSSWWEIFCAFQRNAHRMGSFSNSSFEANFRGFEKILLGRRKAAAVARREANPAMIFRDLQLPPKAPVESLVETVSAQVLEVCEEEQALELDCPASWKEGLPFTCDGLPLHVVHAEADKVWVTCVKDLVPGMRLEQARLIGSLLEIFSEFGSEWGKRLSGGCATSRSVWMPGATWRRTFKILHLSRQ